MSPRHTTRKYPKRHARRDDDSPLTPHLASSRPNVSHLIRKLSNADRAVERTAFDRLATRIPEMNSPSSLISLMRIPSTLNHNAEFSNGGLLSPKPWRSPISKTLKDMLSPKSDEKYTYNKYVSLMRLLSKQLISLPKVTNSKDLAIVAWACGRSNFQCDALTDWLVEGIQELIEQDVGQIQNAKRRQGSQRGVSLKCTPGLISSFLWFVSKHGVTVPNQINLDLCFIAAHQLHSFNDQDFTTLYNSLALMSDALRGTELTPSQSKSAKRLGELLSRTARFEPDDNPSEKNQRGAILSASELPCVYRDNSNYVLQVVLYRLKSLDARRLANFLWAATKCTDWLVRCPVVGVLLIDHLVLPKNVKGYNAQHLSNVYWSCGQILGSSGPRDEGACASEIVYCCEESESYQQLTAPYERDTMKVVYNAADLRVAFSYLFDTLTNHGFPPRIYQSLSCQGLTIVFAAHARIGFPPPPKLLRVLFSRLITVMGYLHHQHIGHIWWTLGQLRRVLIEWLSGKNENVPPSEVEHFVQALTAESFKRRASLTVIQWANLLLGAGELIQIMQTAESATVKDLANHIMSFIYPASVSAACGLKHHVRIVGDIATRCDSLLTASNCIEGMAAAGWRQDTVLRGLCKSIVQLLAEYNPDHLMSPVERDHTSRLLGGLGTLCKLVCVEWAYLGRLVTEVFKAACECIYQSILYGAHQSPSFGATFITRLLHAMTSVGFLHTDLITHLTRVLGDNHRQITSKTTPRLEAKLWAAVFWAAARLNLQPNQSLFTLGLNRLLGFVGTDAKWTESAVNTTLWSLSIVNYRTMSPALVEAVEKHVGRALSWLGGDLKPEEEQDLEIRVVEDDSESEENRTFPKSDENLRFASLKWEGQSLTESEVCHCNQMLMSLISWKLFHPELLESVPELSTSWSIFRSRGIDSRRPYEISRCQELMGLALETLLGLRVGRRPRRRRRRQVDELARPARRGSDWKSLDSEVSSESLDDPLYLEHQVPELGLWCDSILPYCKCDEREKEDVCKTCGKLMGPTRTKGLIVELDGPFHYVATSEAHGVDWKSCDNFDVLRRPPQVVSFRGRNIVASGGTRWKHQALVKAGWDVINLNFIELQSVDMEDTETLKTYILRRFQRLKII